MPALANPRHERFAQCIAAALAGETRLEQAQSTAYRNAGYLAKPGNSAEAAASRLLRRVKPITDRVREIQAQIARKKGRTIEVIVERMALASQIAEEDRNPTAITGAESAIAKVLGIQVERHEHGTPGSFESVDSTADYADTMLKAYSHEQLNVSEGMREMALAELARHAEAMAAIAHGTLGEA